MDLRDKLNQLDNKTLYLNLVVTQCVLLIIGAVLYFFFLRQQLPLASLFHFEQAGLAISIGLIFAIGVIVLDLFLIKILPNNYFDDGGVNKRLFRDVNVFHIALIALLVAFVEEWLFRAVLQNIVGLVFASLIFALIHYRYFSKWGYAILIIILSFGFGLLYEWTNSFWAVFTAHFVIDFVLGLMIRYGWINTDD